MFWLIFMIPDHDISFHRHAQSDADYDIAVKYYFFFSSLLNYLIEEMEVDEVQSLRTIYTQK